MAITIKNQASGAPSVIIDSATVDSNENIKITGSATINWNITTLDLGMNGSGHSFTICVTVPSGSNNAFMIRLTQSPNATSYQSATGYGLYTYQGNGSKLYWYGNPSKMVYGTGGDTGVVYQAGDKLMLTYSAGIFSMYRNNSLICAQDVSEFESGVKYLQITTVSGFSGIPLNISFYRDKSPAISVKTFAGLIASVCRYIGGGRITGSQRDSLINFLIESVSNSKSIINVRSGFKMVNKLRSILSLGTVTVQNSTSALSLNSARDLLLKYLPTSSVSAFTTLNKYYTTSGKGGAGAVGRFIRIAPTNGGTAILNYKLVAGGGGGGGSTTGGGDKNSSYTVTGGAGGKGGNSIIYINGVAKVTATGGAGGSGSTEKAGGNPTMYKNGTSGSAGQTLTGSINIGTRDSITIRIGAGGGGGGGAAAVAGGSTSGQSPWRGGNGGNGVTFNGTNPNSPGGKGGNGAVASNEWIGSECALSGGGGGGGLLGQAGSSWHADNPNKCGGINNSTIGGEWLGGNGAGGKGAITAGGGSGGAGISGQATAGWNGSQPNTWGAGGIYGHGYAKGNTYSVSCGGNGGNAGGFAPTGGNALDVLMFYKSS